MGNPFLKQIDYKMKLRFQCLAPVISSLAVPHLYLCAVKVELVLPGAWWCAMMLEDGFSIQLSSKTSKPNVGPPASHWTQFPAWHFWSCKAHPAIRWPFHESNGNKKNMSRSDWSNYWFTKFSKEFSKAIPTDLGHHQDDLWIRNPQALHCVVEGQGLKTLRFGEAGLNQGKVMSVPLWYEEPKSCLVVNHPIVGHQQRWP